MVEQARSSVGLRQGAIWPYLQLMRPANLVTAAADLRVGPGDEDGVQVGPLMRRA